MSKNAPTYVHYELIRSKCRWNGQFDSCRFGVSRFTTRPNVSARTFLGTLFHGLLKLPITRVEFAGKLLLFFAGLR